jgi:uncharacterized protein involved in response to NO
VAFARHETAALHVITVGALGTLTFNVMAQSWLLRTRREPARSALIPLGTALIAAATAWRALGAIEPAALAWSGAYLLLLVLFSRRWRG